MSFPSTDDTPPIPEFPDDITTMFNAQAELFTHTQWDVDSEIYYDGMLSFPESIPYLTNQKM